MPQYLPDNKSEQHSLCSDENVLCGKSTALQIKGFKQIIICIALLTGIQIVILWG
jgi:hypothetical protein